MTLNDHSHLQIGHGRHGPAKMTPNCFLWHAIEFVSFFHFRICVLFLFVVGKQSEWDELCPLGLKIWSIPVVQISFWFSIPFPFMASSNTAYALTVGWAPHGAEKRQTCLRTVGFTSALPMFNQMFTLHIPGLIMEFSTFFYKYSSHLMIFSLWSLLPWK